MFYVPTEGVTWVIPGEFVGTDCCTYGQLNTNNEIYFIYFPGIR